MIRKISVFFLVTIGMIMIHEWRIFMHLYKNLFMKKFSRMRYTYMIYDRRLVGACKQRALTQMRNVLLDLEEQT